MLQSTSAKIKKWFIRYKGTGKFFAYFIAGSMLVTGIVGSLIYLGSARALELEAIDANQNMLIQLNKSTDLLLSQVDQYLSQLALDATVADFMQYYRSKNLTAQMRINTAISNNLLLMNPYINSCTIFYFKENKVYSVNRGVRNLADFPDRDIFLEAKSGKYLYNRNCFPTRRIVDEKTGKTINVITVVKPIPLDSSEAIGVAVVNIDESYLRDIMNSIIAGDEQKIFVVDDQTRFISSNQFLQPHTNLRDKPYLNSAFRQKAGNYLAQADHQKVLISFVTSEAYNWKYVSIIPYRVIVKRIGFIRNYAFIISFFAIILGIAVSLFFSNKISRPINLIAGLFKDDKNPSDENDVLKYIENNIHRLMAKNESIEKTFLEHLPVLRNNFLTSFLMGAVTHSELEERFDYYGIDLSGSSRYLVYLVSLDSSRGLTGKVSERQLNMLIIYLMEVLNDLPNHDHKKIVVNTKANEIAVVFAFAGKDEESLNRELEMIGTEIQQAVQANANYTFAIAAGNLKREIGQISDSYNEALEAIVYKVLIGNQKVIRYEDIQNLKAENFEYPYEKEKELMDAMKLGDQESVKRISHEIFEFFVNCSESLGDSIYYYYLQLLSSTIRRALRIGINIESIMGEANLYKELLKCNGIGEIQDWFTFLFRELTEHAGQRKNTKNRSIVESIVAYIQENYDQDLSLTALSQQVFLSVPYLSTIFREEYGKPLKQFINETRIEKAKEFLAEPGYQIAEVAEKVGYDKVHAFLRLFKEYTGMTPGQYRKTIIFTQRKTPANIVHFKRHSSPSATGEVHYAGKNKA